MLLLRRFVFLIICMLLGNIFVNAQSMLSLPDLSTVKASGISDADIKKYAAEIAKSGLTIEQAESELQARGLKKEESTILKARLIQVTQSGININDMPAETGRSSSKTTKITSQTSKGTIFGAELFANTNLTFEPNLRIPTPKNYTLGPDDELLIDVYGISQQSYKERVSPEGFVRLNIVGPVYVNGLTIEEATKRITQKLSSFYSGIDFKNYVQVSLGNIRSIRITILGEIVQPGSYTLSSLATVFNALYSSGGPTENGSFRSIEIIRGNKVIRKLDVYDFLLRGDQKDNIRLEDQDIIRIPTYKTHIEISGNVKRQGIFEVLPKETLQTMIDFAGGFNDNAYTKQIKLFRNNGTENTVSDISNESYSSFVLKNGDKLTIGTTLNRFSNRVQINGAVFRPGSFALDSNTTLLQLINKAQGLREDAYLNRALIYRYGKDLSKEIKAVSLEGILQKAAEDLVLQREDSIVIFANNDLQEYKTVKIEGYVRNPTEVAWAKGIKVEDLILAAGGLRESASLNRIEIARRVKNSDFANKTAEYAQIITLDIDASLKPKNVKDSLIEIQPFDIVYVRRTQSYVYQHEMQILGEVNFSGTYVINNKTDRISDMIKRAGGLSPEAYAEGAYLLRSKSSTGLDQEIRNKQIELLKANSDESSIKNTTIDLKDDFQLVAINLEKILKKPGGKYDLIVDRDDIIQVPTLLQTVKITGDVLFPVSVRFEKSNGFRGYINSSGGYGSNAFKRKSYVIYANGAVKRTHKVLFFNFYPRVKPGAQLFVPTKAKKESNVQQYIGASTAIASLALILVTILNATNK